MEPIVGIDLGTTHSAVAYLAEDGPQIIPNALGHRLTPSVVGLDDKGAFLVGQAAKDYAVNRPDRCASLFKRLMGTDRSTVMGGRDYPAEELSGMILGSLKADAEAFFKYPVTRAVITVPAYFNDRQRKATIAAGRIAGFTVERILNEPTAAAIAYGFHEGQQDKTMLVFDLGGGTFDVSVVELFEGALEVRSTAGETSLGGEDFTRTIAARVLDKRGIAFERAEATMPLLVSRLIQQCEWAKKQLSREEAVSIRVPDAAGNLENAATVEILRADMEAWIAPILSRVEGPVRRALVDAKLTRDKIAEVILVGGATRMPMIVQRVTQMFGKPPQCRWNPDEVVALGAAVQAGLVGQHAAVNDMVVTDVAPFTLGIEVTKTMNGTLQGGYFDPLIERNSTIPVSRAKTYSTVSGNQTQIAVKVYQGESRRSEENLFLGEFDVKGIPSGPPGQEVEVRFTYDLNGVLEVQATVVATKKVLTHVIAKHAKGLNEAQIRQAVKNMERLKLHPRDEEMNRFLLIRAERMYKELSNDMRSYLSAVLDGFEGALESRNPEAIENYRQALQVFLSANDPSADDADDDEPTADAPA
jgi:molecular chaperone HscC